MTHPAPKVSICVPTYNHQAYIGRMLDGALAQQTTFPVEIVIGDDASTDNAPAIIRQYANQHPHLIRAFLHPENLGPASPPEFAGRNNVISLLKACRGKYVALCEGDDYWTDPLKLQKQVELLDANPHFSFAHHNMTVIYEDGSPAHPFNPPDQPVVSTIADVLADRWFFATASILYRNYFRTEPFADWHQRAAAGDWALVIQLAARGPIGYLPDTMGVYRKHQGGLSNIQSGQNRFFLENRRTMFADVDKWLRYQRHDVLQQTIQRYTDLLETV